MRFLIAAALLAASPAAAQDWIPFKSPSGNIACMMFSGDYAGVRCDIFQVSTLSYRRPPDCDLDWGQAFEVGVTGSGYPLCYGDTVADPGAAVLAYGTSWTYFGITCTSERTGMTCVNPAGHGFTIARAGQRVF